MKNFKLSLLAIALFMFASVCLTSCGGDESEDPKPVVPPTKTDLELVKENIVGVEILTLSAVVNGVELLDLCNPGADYVNSVENMLFTFTTATTVHINNECVGGETDLTYTITQTDNIFTVQMKNSSGNLLVNANFNKADFIDSNGKILAQAKGTFKEIASPKNWVHSPVITLKKMN